MVFLSLNRTRLYICNYCYMYYHIISYNKVKFTGATWIGNEIFDSIKSKNQVSSKLNLWCKTFWSHVMNAFCFNVLWKATNWPVISTFSTWWTRLLSKFILQSKERSTHREKGKNDEHCILVFLLRIMLFTDMKKNLNW